LIFVCVVLGSPGTCPEYFVFDGAVVDKERSDYPTRAILNIGRVKHFQDNWGLISSRLKIRG